MRIERIEDVLPFVENRPDFVIKKCDGYTVIDYLYSDRETFTHRARIECRGIKFDDDGYIIARPFQKFFNFKETEDTQNLDFSNPHIVMEKLDGSMIHAAIVDSQVVFMTRMGITDVAKKCAERHLSDQVNVACRNMLHLGVTPIFEWTAPDNRIILPYEESKLTVLALRDMIEGTYLDQTEVSMFADAARLPMIATMHSCGDLVLPLVKDEVGIEGFVVRFDNGFMVKAKSDDYVLKHRAKGSISQERHILALIIGGNLDDVLPVLNAQERERAECYRDEVSRGIAETVSFITSFIDESRDVPQKQFAVSKVSKLPPAMRPIAFQVRAGGDPRSVIKQTILKQVGSRLGLESVRPLFKATFAAANDNVKTEIAA